MRALLISVVVALFPFLFVTAQTNDEGLAFLDFGLLNPGARALGMGGAFIGMADDATAAYTNPAGLTTLIHPEASLEYGANRYRNDIPWFSGTRTSELIDMGNGTEVERNFEFDFDSGDFPVTSQNLSFASFVYPIHVNRFVISGQYSEPTNFQRKFQTEGFKTFTVTREGNLIENSSEAADSSLRLRIKNFGFSAGYRLGSRWNFGFTLNVTTLDLDSKNRRVDPETRDGTAFGPIGNDTKLSYSAGFLLKPLAKFSVGAVYVRRPEFSIISSIDSFGFFSFHNELEQTFRVPDSIGAGVSWQPSERFSVNADVIKIQYSQLMDGYYNFFYTADPEDFLPSSQPYFQKSSLEVQDGVEFRTGAEYVLFYRDTPIFLRAGYWREPFHSIVQKVNDADLEQIWQTVEDPCQCGGTITFLVNDTLAVPYFSRSFINDSHHITIGAGFLRDEISLDAAFDYSKSSQRFVISTVFYFKSF